MLVPAGLESKMLPTGYIQITELGLFIVSTAVGCIMRIYTQSFISAVLAVMALVASQPGLAGEYDEESKPAKRAISSYDAFSSGRGTRDSSMSSIQSEMSLRSSDLNRAIKMGRRAVELDPEDVDARVALGNALFQKVKSSKKEDPALFNECVKTWLMVHRNVIGFEKADFKGLGIPGFQKMYEDEDHGILAKSRLVDLCGRPPKMFETNRKYLDKVLHAETAVSAVVIKKPAKDSENK